MVNQWNSITYNRYTLHNVTAKSEAIISNFFKPEKISTNLEVDLYGSAKLQTFTKRVGQPVEQYSY